MKLYRITDKAGRGLYRKIAKAVGMPMFESDDHPMPRTDSVFMSNAKPFLKDGGYIPNTLRYAFVSEHQLRRWMYNDTWLSRCEALGAQIRVYEVPDKFAVVGTTQCAYLYGKARLVEKRKPTSLINKC